MFNKIHIPKRKGFILTNEEIMTELLMFKVVVSGGAGVSIEIFSEIPPLSDEPGLAGDVLNLLIAAGESVIGLVWSGLVGLIGFVMFFHTLKLKCCTGDIV